MLRITTNKRCTYEIAIKMSQIIVGTKTSLVFKVTKQKPELITPAEATPYEVKLLSDIDDQSLLRVFVPLIQFYRSGPSGLDPVKVIKEGLRKALVAYYPFAGRLREMEKGKLVIECNGEGVMFIEADADVTLADFGEPLYPPFPCTEKLFCDIYNSEAILDYPLFLFQVTRLKYGGFILAQNSNHVVADGNGLTRFMNAIAELAHGAELPSVHLVWERHLLSARNPPQVTCVHREYDKIDDTYGPITPLEDVVHASFFFGPLEVEAVKRALPAHLKSSPTIEVVIACIWRSHTIAMQLNPNDEVRVRFIVNAQPKFKQPLPPGYYGNVLATPVAISTANNLVSNPLCYTLELIKRAKGIVTEEYMKSLADFMVINRRPQFNRARTFVVTDISRVGYDQWDFGWGKPVFGGPVNIMLSGAAPRFGNYLMAGKNGAGENGIVVPMYLPRSIMNRFTVELNGYLRVAAL